MIHQVIHLRDDDPDIPLTAYVADEGWKTRDAMLVIPGGGYGCVCSDREGEPIALAFLARGYNCTSSKIMQEFLAINCTP